MFYLRIMLSLHFAWFSFIGIHVYCQWKDVSLFYEFTIFVCMLFSYVLMCPFMCMFSQAGRMSLLWAFIVIVPRYIYIFSGSVCLLLSVVMFMLGVKCGIVCVNVCVFHMEVIPTYFINVVFFKVFKCLPFLPVLMTIMISVIVLYVCPVFSMWFEYQS
jgi:hypothetical protein